MALSTGTNGTNCFAVGKRVAGVCLGCEYDASADGIGIAKKTYRCATCFPTKVPLGWPQCQCQQCAAYKATQASNGAGGQQQQQGLQQQPTPPAYTQAPGLPQTFDPSALMSYLAATEENIRVVKAQANEVPEAMGDLHADVKAAIEKMDYLASEMTKLKRQLRAKQVISMGSDDCDQDSDANV